MDEKRNFTGAVDLHLHSLASDGTLSPAEVVEAAARNGVCVMALTDHETTLGIPAAMLAGQEWRVEVIPGIEMTVEEGEELHLLGYFIDFEYPLLQETLLVLRRRRAERAHRILQILSGMGMDLEWASIGVQTWNSIGRPHVARALHSAGYVSSPKEAFDRYLDPGRPAYVHLPRPSAPEVIEMIRGAGGVAALAHPIILGRDDPAQRLRHIASILPRLRAAGLEGIESYYPEYPPELTRSLVELADATGLVPTGGSDFHGPSPRREGPGGIAVPYVSVERLRAKASLLEMKVDSPEIARRR